MNHSLTYNNTALPRKSSPAIANQDLVSKLTVNTLDQAAQKPLSHLTHQEAQERWGVSYFVQKDWLMASRFVQVIAQHRHFPLCQMRNEADPTIEFVNWSDGADELHPKHWRLESFDNIVRDAYRAAGGMPEPSQLAHLFKTDPYFLRMDKSMRIFIQAAFETKISFQCMTAAAEWVPHTGEMSFQMYERFLFRIRKLCTLYELRKDMYDRNVKLPKLRFSAVKFLLDRLLASYSRVLPVRVDFKYKEHAVDSISFELHQHHVQELIRLASLNPAFKNSIGYVYRIEQAPLTGLHTHAVFFFDGSKSQQDAVLARELVRVWDEDVTQGSGAAFNVNVHWYEQVESGKRTAEDCALVMLHRDDFRQKQRLLDVLSYLCKSGSEPAIKPNQRSKTFFTA